MGSTARARRRRDPPSRVCPCRGGHLGGQPQRRRRRRREAGTSRRSPSARSTSEGRVRVGCRRAVGATYERERGRNRKWLRRFVQRQRSFADDAQGPGPPRVVMTVSARLLDPFGHAKPSIRGGCRIDGGVRSTVASGRERHSDRFTSTPGSSVAEVGSSSRRAQFRTGRLAGTDGTEGASASTICISCPFAGHCPRPSIGVHRARIPRRDSSPPSTRTHAFGRWGTRAIEATSHRLIDTVRIELKGRLASLMARLHAVVAVGRGRLSGYSARSRSFVTTSPLHAAQPQIRGHA